MDTIDKWLKSLRLHKYTHLFKSLTYDEMLNLEEKYLIEMNVTKGARNKMLVSVKKLNLRQERLINMMDDLNQDNISMKEALTVLKDMLITPIPGPPYELTFLFIETLEKVAQRLIESAGFEDNACHGIMAAIVDECLKHNSFTKEQKAKVAGFKHLTKEQQKAKVASFKQQLRLQHQLQHLQHQQQQQQHSTRPQHSYSHNHYQQHQQHHQQQRDQQQQQEHNNHQLLQQQQQQQQQHQFHLNNHNQQHHYHYHHNHWNGPIKQQHQQQQPPSLSASLSTIGSASTSDEDERGQTYREYSLLGPGMTFELPCLRASAAAAAATNPATNTTITTANNNETTTTTKYNRSKLCFLSVFQN